MRYIGILIVIFGAVDVGGSWMGFDVWTDYIGVQLPDFIWSISGYVEIGIGYFLFNLANSTDELIADEETG